MKSFMPIILGSLLTGASKRRPTVVNPSGLVPVGHAILLEPYEPDFDAARKRGLIIPDQLRNNSIMVEMRSRVIALGDEAYRPENATWLRRLMTPWRPRCLPGDKIMVQKMTGAIVVGPLDGKQYRLVNEEDVFVKITAEAVPLEYPH
jgi:co-chaperonin GroES (HSP10)